jgi:hypothetical protein
MHDTILALQQRGRVLLLGDFNAHTGSLADVAPPTGDDVLRTTGAAALAPSAWGVPAGRLNPDRTSPTVFCRWLVERVCLPTVCVILNGRAPGTGGLLTLDTRQQADRLVRSCARGICIDYALTDARLHCSLVAAFNVLPNHRVSDHNILECTLLPPPSAPAPLQPPPMATPRPPPPPSRNTTKHADWVAAIKSADSQQQLDAALALPGPAAEATYLRTSVTVRAPCLARTGRGAGLRRRCSCRSRHGSAIATVSTPPCRQRRATGSAQRSGGGGSGATPLTQPSGAPSAAGSRRSLTTSSRPCCAASPGLLDS